MAMLNYIFPDGKIIKIERNNFTRIPGIGYKIVFESLDVSKNEIISVNRTVKEIIWKYENGSDIPEINIYLER